MDYSPDDDESINKARFGLISAILVLAPLFRAGNRPLPLMLLELLALAALVSLILEPRWWEKLDRRHLLFSIALLAIPLFYLLPLPGFLWEMLPGRSDYLAHLRLAAGEGGIGWKSISLVPLETEMALWNLLLMLAVFLLSLRQSTQNIEKLVYLLIGMACFQAVLGLMQFGAGAASPLYFGNPADGSASGTYPSRDHFAGFMEMVFPVVLALLAAVMGQGAKKGTRPRLKQRILFFSTLQGHQAAIFAGIGVLLVLALIFSRSRAGLGLAMVGLLIAMFAFFRRLGGTNVYGAMGSVVAAIVVLAVEIGLAPVLDRFSQDPLEDLRWRFFSSAMDGVGRFFPLGSGLGNFPQVYPANQPQEISSFVNNAHNDYLESLFEGGIVTAIFLLLFFVLYARQWANVWSNGHWGRFRFIQVGAGIGVVLMLMHSFVDFNLHIPANAVYFAFLLAVFFSPYAEDPQNHSHRRQKRSHRTHHSAGNFDAIRE